MKTQDQNVQFIMDNGIPTFAVIPYEKYLELTNDLSVADTDDSNIYIPQEVAEIMLINDLSFIAAWRKHLKISQKELASRMGITQAAVSQMEKLDATPQRKSLEKCALAMGISVAQLSDD
ncbi:helix-turn-helix transcriptional regulator [Photobacterium toruni]|uniref:Helix-turn-helix transcriptional regulator n=1 Tax=Photobacterium toruni TaxID=1935446 RepID=A0ABU6L9G8_9GAMM|nr:helix-turn-helix transcriptional regulator [Photobacterium toruni]